MCRNKGVTLISEKDGQDELLDRIAMVFDTHPRICLRVECFVNPCEYKATTDRVATFSIEIGMIASWRQYEPRIRRCQFRECLGTLNERERQVLDLLVKGKSN